MTDIDRVCELSKQGHYDFTIVGSGLAGGILARKLVENNKRVLLIEKGGLTFSTHSLNTSRPHWQIGSIQGPSQDNDVIYSAVKQKVQTAAGSDMYVGGPVYSLGGRSNVWGLYSPRVIEGKLRHFFPQNIVDYLEKEGYQSAFGLFTNNSQNYDHIYPQDDISATEMNEARKDLHNALKEFYHTLTKSGHIPAVEFSPLAAEFKSSKLYNFPQGAYSTVDFLLDRTYAKDANLTILLNTEVLNFLSNDQAGTSSLTVRSSANGKIYQLFSKTTILSAGTIGTATIALNSGLQQKLPAVGKGLTDHEIWGVRFLKKTKPNDPLKDPMKFQSRILIGGEDALLNVAINANTFLAREFSHSQFLSPDGKLLDCQPSGEDSYDTVNVTIERQEYLSAENEVLNIPSPDPVIYIKRTIDNPAAFETRQVEMQRLATFIRNNILGIPKKTQSDLSPAPRLSLAGFGAVAHEVGTMRIQGPKFPCVGDFVVNEKLQVQGYTDLYVCDLSVFPFSPPANPSLTLAGIALMVAGNLLLMQA